MNEATEFSNRERLYVMELAARKLAEDLSRNIELLYPEQVAFMCKCDVRTLEKKGLQRRYMGRSVRYRRSDVEALIEASTIEPAKNTFPQGSGDRVKSGLKSDPRRSR
jgi:hypothetical protein